MSSPPDRNRSGVPKPDFSGAFRGERARSGPRIVPKYLTRSWEDVSRPWKCLRSRRLCRGERLPRIAIGLIESQIPKRTFPSHTEPFPTPAGNQRPHLSTANARSPL